MTKTRILIIVCFLVAFAAGISGGLVVGRRPGRRGPPPFLVQQLDLTPEQAEQVRDIWSEARDSLRASLMARREALEQVREGAMLSILTPDQVALYQEVMTNYWDERDRLAEERRAAVDEAIEQTKRVLTDEQKAKYETLLEERRKEGGPPWGRGRRLDPRSSDSSVKGGER